MVQRYFSSTPLTLGRPAMLTGAEAHHLRDVMRLGRGDRVTLFDGGGSEFVAEITAATRGAVELKILDESAVDRELDFDLVLGVALPKGERQRWLVEKAVELGVARLVPLATERGVAEATAGAIERMRRAVIEAAKQCGRNRLMEIAAPLAWSEYLAQAPLRALRLVAHPGPESALPAIRGGEPRWLACGPEGGFSDAEMALAREAGWTSVSLGPRILRVETAALALAALAAAGHYR